MDDAARDDGRDYGTCSSTENSIEKALTCSVCLGRYTKPKLLPCSHVFCRHCLSNIQEAGQSGFVSITCPLCRNKAKMKGTDSLPTCLSIESLLEISNFENLMAGREVGVVACCGNCQCQVDCRSTTSWCKQCAIYLCSECLHHHNNWKPNTGHEIFSINSPDLKQSISHLKQSAILSLKPKQSISPIKAESSYSFTCPNHEMPFSKFCKICKQNLCLICSEQEHDCSKGQDTRDTFEFLSRKSSYLQECLTLLLHHKNALTHQADDVRKEIKIFAADIITKVKEKETKLVSEVDRALALKHAVIDGQIQEVEAELNRLDQCSSDMVHLAKLDTIPDEHGKFHYTKRQVFHQVANTVNGIKGKVFTPLEKMDFEFVPLESAISDDCSFGEVLVVCIASSIKICFKWEDHGWRSLSVNEYQNRRNEVSFKLQSNAEVIRLPPSVLQCTSDKDSTEISVVESPEHLGTYTVTNNKSTVTVSVGGYILTRQDNVQLVKH